MTREEIAAKNRARAPDFAAFVDIVRKHCGPGLSLRYYDDGNGYVIGEPGEQGVQVSAPPPDMEALKEEDRKAEERRRRGRS